MVATNTRHSLVNVQDLKVYFPVFGGVLQRQVAMVKAVDGVSFDIKKGETVGLVGESGCGKTTVGRAMINVLRHIAPDVKISGSITYNFNGEQVDVIGMKQGNMTPYRSRIQMIFQDPYSSLNPRMSIAQIISEPLALHTHLSKTEKKEKVKWLLDKVGMNPEQSPRYPHEFSGGQRQRVGIARALATNPDLIICDEPVSALDVSIQAQVINLMQDLQEEFNLSYLFIAHDLSVVEHISNRIAVMYLGNIAEFGDGQIIYHQPLHPYTKALLSSVPLPDPKQRRAERTLLKGDVPTPLAKPSGCGFRTRCPIVKSHCAERPPPLVQKNPGQFVACFEI